MKFDPSTLKLGARLSAPDPRTLPLARYLTPATPTPPRAIDYGTEVSTWGMLGNDELGDCTMAGLLHTLMIWLTQNGKAGKFTTAQAVALYQRFCGYVPGDDSTDQGGDPLEIFKAWLKEPVEGVALGAFVEVDPKNWAHVMLAHFLFGSLYIAVNLPKSAQNEKIWSATTDKPGSWDDSGEAGHLIVSSGYKDGQSCLHPSLLTVVTWGEEQHLTPKWLAKYGTLILAPLSPAWISDKGVAPNQLNMAQLRADLASVRS